MAKPSTFIMLDRNIMRWSWYKNFKTKTLFIHLILKANWEDYKFEDCPINRGQLATSVDNLSEETGLSVSEVRTALKHLESTNEISVANMHKFSLITITNYNVYQSFHEPTANESQSNHDNIIIKENKNYNNIISKKTKLSKYMTPEERKREYEELAKEYA